MPSPVICLWALASVAIVSLVSLVGVAAISCHELKLKQMALVLMSLSVGALLGDAFLHLLPEAFHLPGNNALVPFLVLAGMGCFFLLEKTLHLSSLKHFQSAPSVRSFGYLNLFGDAVHNFIDGLLIGAAFLVSLPVGLSTTVAVILHEIPQEIGDFGVLLHAGFTKDQALRMNFLCSLTALLGTLVALFGSSVVEHLPARLVPFAAGGFIYIAGSSLVPELQKETALSQTLLQCGAILVGVTCMAFVLLWES